MIGKWKRRALLSEAKLRLTEISVDTLTTGLEDHQAALNSSDRQLEETEAELARVREQHDKMVCLAMGLGDLQVSIAQAKDAIVAAGYQLGFLLDAAGLDGANSNRRPGG